MILPLQRAAVAANACFAWKGSTNQLCGGAVHAVTRTDDLIAWASQAAQRQYEQ